MHPLDALAADPALLAEIEATAGQAARAICMSPSGVVVDEAAVRHLGILLACRDNLGPGVPASHDGQRVWRLVQRFDDLVTAIHTTGRGPVAPTFDAHDRDVESRRGGWFEVHGTAHKAFSELVRAGLLPPSPPPASRLFWDAMNRYDVRAISDLLADGLDLQDLPTYGYGPPVYEALSHHYYGHAWNDAAAVVRLLVRRGALANAPRQAGGQTPLELAMEFKDPTIADLIWHLAAADGSLQGASPPLSGIQDRAAPGAADAVVVSGADRDSGTMLRVRASTLDDLREGLAALGVVQVEASFFVTVDCHGAGWTDTYSLDELPDTLLRHVRLADAQHNAGYRFVFDVEGQP